MMTEENRAHQDAGTAPPARVELSHRQLNHAIELVRSVRPDWHAAGIRSAILDACQVASNPGAVIAAAVTAAALVGEDGRPEARTPAVIPLPGHHWPGRVEREAVKSRAHTYAVACIDHPQERMPCRACAAETEHATPARIAALRDAIRHPKKEATP